MELERMFDRESNNYEITDSNDVYSFIDEHEDDIIDLFRRGAYQKDKTGYERCIKDFCLNNDIELKFSGMSYKDIIYEIDWNEAYADIIDGVEKLERVYNSMSEFLEEHRNNKNFTSRDVKHMLANWGSMLTKISETLGD